MARRVRVEIIGLVQLYRPCRLLTCTPGDFET